MTLSGGPLERRSMSDEAFVRLQDAIISGELQPGERLRDYELAERLGTSKTPIRHALDRLADNGLVEMQRNRYTRVAPIDLERVRNAVDLFGDIWIGSVRHVMPVIQDDDVAYLVELADDMAASVQERDIIAFGAGLRSAATGFARIEGNATRANSIERLGPQIRRFTQHAKDAVDWSAVEEFVGAIREATSERDAVKTRAVLVTFFDETLPAIIDRAEQSGLAEISGGSTADERGRRHTAVALVASRGYGVRRWTSRGNSVTSRTLAASTRRPTQRSSPMAKPPWGGIPCANASR